MNRKIRLVIGLIIILFSISLLVWGYSPNPREIRERMIPPAELQLPTPSSLHFNTKPVS